MLPLLHQRAAGCSTTHFYEYPKKLASKSGVGFGTVQRAKNGDGNITVEKLAAIAEAFGKTVADLVAPSTAYSQAAGATQLRVEEPVQFKTPRDERITAITALLDRKDDFGVVALLEKAKEIAREYPRRKNQTAS